MSVDADPAEELGGTSESAPAEPVSGPGRFGRVWPQIRAALIFLHLAAMLVMCLPAPYNMASKRSWQTPQAQAEAATWAKNLRSVGISTTAEELTEGMHSFTRGYLRLHGRLNQPFRPYQKLANMRQGWSMFSHPQTHPGWLHIDIRSDIRPRGQSYRPIYIQHSEQHTWRRDQFEHNRVRKLLGRIARRPKGHPAYKALTRWIARQVARDFPDATHVRVRHFRRRTLKPGSGEAPKGRFVEPLVLPLDPYR